MEIHLFQHEKEAEMMKQKKVLVNQQNAIDTVQQAHVLMLALVDLLLTFGGRNDV